MPAPRKYPSELRERAIRLTLDARKDPASRSGGQQLAGAFTAHLAAEVIEAAKHVEVLEPREVLVDRGIHENSWPKAMAARAGSPNTMCSPGCRRARSAGFPIS